MNINNLSYNGLILALTLEAENLASATRIGIAKGHSYLEYADDIRWANFKLTVKDCMVVCRDRRLKGELWT